MTQHNANGVDVAMHHLEDPDDAGQRRLFEAAYLLYDQLFVEEEKDGKEELLSSMAGGDGRKAPWVVAVDRSTGQVVGGTVVTVFDERPASTFGYHFTDRRLRGQGIGRRLQEAALDYIKRFNERKAAPADANRIRILADIENPARMSFRDILITTAKAGIDPWARARFWERLGFLPVVSSRTGEAFPFVVIPDAEDAEPTKALDLWVKQPWGDAQADSFAFDTRDVTQDVVFWLFGATDLRRGTYRPPFNHPALDEMISWHENHPQIMSSTAYLSDIRKTEAAFRRISADFIEANTRNTALADDIKSRTINIGDTIHQLMEIAPYGLDALDVLWAQEARA